MTYGEGAADLRDTLGILIHRRRPGVMLGGATSHGPAKVSLETTQEAVGEILRFRAVLWGYTITALDTATPVRMAPAYEPAVRVLGHLAKNRPNPTLLPDGRGANMDDLCTPSPFPLVDLWRHAAVTAVTNAERELPLLRDNLDPPQRMLLVKDACETIRAIVRLDDRYCSLPGWVSYGGRESKLRARPRHTAGYRINPIGLYSSVLRCEDWASVRLTDQSYTIDQLGHRPPLQRLEVDPAGGVDAALTGLHNVRVALRDGLPTMSAMTTLLRHNRLMSGAAYRLARYDHGSGLAVGFEQRACTYADLLLATVNVGGRLGDGTAAVDASRGALNALKHEEAVSSPQLARLAEVFQGVDADLSALLRRGISQHLYGVTNHRALTDERIGGVARSEDRYEPITAASHPVLLDHLASLRPATKPLTQTDAASAARGEFRELLDTGFGRPRRNRSALAESVRGASIDPTRADFDRLVIQAHPQGLRVDAL